jgi:hypothetical protein
VPAKVRGPVLRERPAEPAHLTGGRETLIRPNALGIPDPDVLAQQFPAVANEQEPKFSRRRTLLVEKSVRAGRNSCASREERAMILLSIHTTSSVGSIETPKASAA